MLCDHVLDRLRFLAYPNAFYNAFPLVVVLKHMLHK